MNIGRSNFTPTCVYKLEVKMSRKEVKCYHCKELVNKETAKVEVYEGSTGKQTNRYFHEECYEKYKFNQLESRKLDEVCQYIKTEILGIDKKFNVPRMLVDRILGLHSGQYAPRKNSKVFGEEVNGYPYEVILKTVKYKKLEMVISLKDQSKFKDDQHKINHVIVIIQNHINDVYWKLKQKEESDKRLDSLDIKFNENQQEFKSNAKITENKVSKKLKHLW